jgi:tripartite-type tricarboxylate transporter receptor subunit TctC
VARYNAVANEILRAPDVVDKFTKQGIDAVGGTSEEFRSFIAADLTKWTKILKDAGIVAE